LRVLGTRELHGDFGWCGVFGVAFGEGEGRRSGVGGVARVVGGSVVHGVVAGFVDRQWFGVGLEPGLVEVVLFRGHAGTGVLCRDLHDGRTDVVALLVLVAGQLRGDFGWCGVFGVAF